MREKRNRRGGSPGTEKSTYELEHAIASDVDGDNSGDFSANKRCLPCEPYEGGRDGTGRSEGQFLVRPRQWREPNAQGESGHSPMTTTPFAKRTNLRPMMT